MTQAEFDSLPQVQREGCRRVAIHQRIEWNEFLERAQAPCGKLMPYVGISVNGMFIGIEPDGYSHT